MSLLTAITYLHMIVSGLQDKIDTVQVYIMQSLLTQAHKMKNIYSGSITFLKQSQHSYNPNSEIKAKFELPILKEKQHGTFPHNKILTLFHIKSLKPTMKEKHNKTFPHNKPQNDFFPLGGG